MRHPAALDAPAPAEQTTSRSRAPSINLDKQAPLLAPVWHHRRRLALPGPDWLVMPALRLNETLSTPTTLPLARPAATLADSMPLTQTDVAEAMGAQVSWDEPAVLETLEALEHPPEMASTAAEAAEALRPILLTGDGRARPGRQGTGWWPAWRRRQREQRAEGRPFWDVDPIPAEQESPETQRSRWPWGATVAAAAGGVALAGASMVMLLPSILPQSPGTVAVFNAPMIVLRASGPGRITTVAVKTGQAVDPSSLLMVIRTAPKSDSTALTAQNRLDAAQQRVTALNEAIAQAALTGDAARGRGIELRRQRDAAAADLAAAQEAAAHSVTPEPADQPVLAGVHGVIWSLEAQAGTDTVAGAPLVRMVDCDHPFLTVGNNSGLRAGDAVVVRLPDLPPVPAMVRAASGVAEPPGGLVVAPVAASLPRDCPIGASATVSPAGKAA
jgi:hypothetical protein